jgi:hypothetical protein
LENAPEIEKFHVYGNEWYNGNRDKSETGKGGIQL